MIQKLPMFWIAWEKAYGFTPEKIDELVKKDQKEYILEVDVDYPKKLHKNHSELPFLAGGMEMGKARKVVPNLKSKKYTSNA